MGGLQALFYAKKFPVKKLILWSAITGKYTINQASANSLLGKIILSKKGKKLISFLLKISTSVFPKTTIRSFLQAEADIDEKEITKISNEIINCSEKKNEFKQFVYTLTPMSSIYDGMMQEVAYATAFSNINWFSISCPTLAIYSKVDKDVGIEHAEKLEKEIKALKMIKINGAGHFVWWGNDGDKVKNHTLRFLFEDDEF